MATKMNLFLGNSTIVELSALRTQAGVYINDATVTVTLKDANGTEVVGEDWPLSMSHDGGTNGTYTATLLSTLTLVENALYIAEIDVSADEGTAKWETEVRAKARD